MHEKKPIVYIMSDIAAGVYTELEYTKNGNTLQRVVKLEKQGDAFNIGSIGTAVFIRGTERVGE